MLEKRDLVEKSDVVERRDVVKMHETGHIDCFILSHPSSLHSTPLSLLFHSAPLSLLFNSTI